MTPEVLQTLALTGMGTAGTAALGGIAWGIRRVIQKVDTMDTLIRGEGNGNPGINECIRDVHAEVREVRKDFKNHLVDHPL